MLTIKSCVLIYYHRRGPPNGLFASFFSLSVLKKLVGDWLEFENKPVMAIFGLDAVPNFAAD